MLSLLLALLPLAAPPSTELVACTARGSEWSFSIDSRLSSGSATVLGVTGRGRDFAVALSDGNTLTTRFVDDPNEKALAVSFHFAAEDVCPLPQSRLASATLEKLASQTSALPAPVKLAAFDKAPNAAAWELTVRPGLRPSTAVVEAKGGADFRFLVEGIERKGKSLKLTGRGAACYASAGRHCQDSKVLVLDADKVVFDVTDAFSIELGRSTVDAKGRALLESLMAAPSKSPPSP